MNITDDYKDTLMQYHAGDTKWGSSVVKFGAHDILVQIQMRPYIKTLLDYGCGKGVLKEFLAQHAPHVTVTEYDPGIPGIDKLPTKKFDMVVTCDVLEHVEIECMPDTIANLAELTRYVMYNNIACSLTGHTFKSGPYKGKDIHITVRPPEGWRAIFCEALHGDPKMSLMEYRHTERRWQGDFRTRAVLIHERVG